MHFRKNSTRGLRYFLVTVVTLVALCLTGCDPLGGSSATSNPASPSSTKATDSITCPADLAYTQAVVPAQTTLGVPTTKVIVTTNCGTGKREFVPPSGGSYYSPSLSPNGQTVAFSELRDGANSIELYIGSVATGRVTKLTTEAGSGTNASFSPDSTQIAYSWEPDIGTNLADAGIYIVPANGGAMPVKVSDILSGYPAWAPDGKSLAITESLGQDNFLLATVDIASHTQTELVVGLPGQSGAAFYSPDGKFLLFPIAKRAKRNERSCGCTTWQPSKCGN